MYQKCKFQKIKNSTDRPFLFHSIFISFENLKQIHNKTLLIYHILIVTCAIFWGFESGEYAP